MGSRGSVIPLFQQQVKDGLPLTLTVPYMTRFLMTLDQSVDLVFHAMTHARGGEIFVRKSPASTVADLARAVAAKWSSLGTDHPTTVVGIRSGEKIHEVLVNEYEMQRVTEHPDYYVIHPEYRIPDRLAPKPHGVEYTSENTCRLESVEGIGALLDTMGQVEYYT
jgi:UDP-glucose 4-epimerase